MAALVALVSSLLWGGADFAGGLISRRLPSAVVVGWSQVCTAAILWPVVLVWVDLPGPGRWLAWGVAAGFAGVGGLVTFYRALAVGTMGVVSPIAALGAVVPVLVAVAAGERPTWVQVAGMVLALAGAVAAAGVLFGLTLTFIALGSTGADAASGPLGGAAGPLLTVAAMRLASLVLFGTAALVRRGVGPVGVRDVPALVGVGVADASANMLYGLASTMGLVSVVAVLGSLYPVVTVLLARGLLGERLQPIQTVGVAVAITGVALLAAG